MKGRRQHPQLMNDVGDNMRPLGTTPPPLPPSSSSSSSLYPQVFPPSNPSMPTDPHHHHAHHQYGAFGSGFGAAVACSSSGYPTFFSGRALIAVRVREGIARARLAPTRGYDGLSPFSTPYNRPCPTYPPGIQTNLSPGKRAATNRTRMLDLLA